MSALAPDRHRLRVRKWCNRHLVSEVHPAPDRVRDQIDDAVRRDLGRAVAARLALAAHDDGAVVFVRRLELDWTVDVGGDPDDITRMCALVLARDLLHEIATDTTGNVVRFSSPAEYLASYVLWRARDLGPPPWFYEPFEGWATLPASAAIRAALCDNDEIGRDALTVLSPDSLAQVARIVTRHDAQAIVHALAEFSVGEPRPSRIRTVLAATLSCPPPAAVFERDGLIIWLLARAPLADASSLHTAARILRVVNGSRKRSGRTVNEALANLCDESMSGAIQEAARGDDSRLLARLAERVDTANTAFTTADTPYGGLFLMLDAMEREAIERATVAMTELHGTAAADLLTFIILCHCLGHETWQRAFEDSFWRTTLRIAPAIDLTTAAEWLGGSDGTDGPRPCRLIEADDGPSALPDELDCVIDRSGLLPSHWAATCGAAAARALRRFARRLPGFGDASCMHLWNNLLDLSATVEGREDRVVVRLTRAPLDVILRLSGQTRGERRWPWLDARPFVLFSGE
jgi:hypothetical protein